MFRKSEITAVIYFKRDKENQKKIIKASLQELMVLKGLIVALLEFSSKVL